MQHSKLLKNMERKDWKAAYKYYVLAAEEGHIEAQTKAGEIASNFEMKRQLRLLHEHLMATIKWKHIYIAMYAQI